jgi:hypothetical protein
MAGMKVLAITLLISAILVCSLGVAEISEGIHSTPGIWLAFLTLPGGVFTAWVNGWPGYVIAAIVNSLLYAGFFQLVRHINRIANRPD